ncbi:MAG: UDP-N-acetylmuramoyl-L-alanyl-D-glutamate--2,6-diaminopimelate ligase [Lachnospiraceae bacterium]|nr:UDP-N-acetylmuramoyl-L-alanyl-D-glutamate--2,6-diaminopimelate ligase [Lachnospiraceae bacterium]
MRLESLLEQLQTEGEITAIQGNKTVEVSKLVYDTRNTVSSGDLFVCIAGAVFDGHTYAEEAIKAGASVIVAQRELTVPENVTLVVVKDTRKALAYLSAAWFRYPAKELITIGITGTKGKTTTAYMVYHILEKVGIKTGLVGTVEVRNGKEIIPASHTTPESYLLQQYFRQMVENGCKAVVMEVSSQALKLSRVGGIVFDYGVFTNLEPDHIGPNEHTDFEDYAECKSRLFKQCRFGILNADDRMTERMLIGSTCERMTYGCNDGADLQAVGIDLHRTDGKLMVSYQTKGALETELAVSVPGMFTVYNSLTAAAICKCLKVPAEVMKKAFLEVQVKGRLESIHISPKFSLMIDYAHNAMSLKSLLTALKEYKPKRLVCLFGCGGNRSRDRRFEMGEISSRYADLTIVTSDNPRFEEPEAIIEDILTGVKKADGAYVTIPDRKEAIRYAILNAKEEDVIVLAGKGHEDYQEIRGVKYPMDERVLINEIISEMSKEEKFTLGIEC